MIKTSSLFETSIMKKIPWLFAKYNMSERSHYDLLITNRRNSLYKLWDSY